jgi:hypothetical protein
MVQAIENKAEIAGEVVQVASGSAVPDTLEVIVRVSRVAPFENYPNMFAWAVGRTISVRMSQQDAAGIEPGTTIAARVQNIGPGAAMADPGTVRKVPGDGNR